MSKAIGFGYAYLRALAISAYVFTIGVLKNKHRRLIDTINERYGYRRRAVTPLIPTVTPADLLAPDAAIQLRAEDAALGNISLLELICIVKLTKMTRPKAILEIGTFDGRTALNMAANCDADAKVFTLDLPRTEAEKTKFPLDKFDRFCVEKEKSGARFVGSDCAGKITQLYGDSATFDFTPHQGSTDLVFVDGAHSYDYVMSDSAVALSLLRGGKGVVLWHDYDQWDGVTQGLNELYQRGGPFSQLRWIAGTSLVSLIVK